MRVLIWKYLTSISLPLVIGVPKVGFAWRNELLRIFWRSGLEETHCNTQADPLVVADDEDMSIRRSDGQKLEIRIHNIGQSFRIVGQSARIDQNLEFVNWEIISIQPRSEATNKSILEPFNICNLIPDGCGEQHFVVPRMPNMLVYMEFS